MIKKIILGISIILFGLIVYLFLFGKFFAFSPIIIGFTKHELPKTIIYTQNNTEYNNIKYIDTLIPSVQRFHELKFNKKPKIFTFNDSITYLHHSFSKARFCAFSSGRLFVSPWALEEANNGKISLSIYLKHELSHVLILQHKGIFSELNYPKWLLEGIAVYSSDQMGTSFYPSKKETYLEISQGNFMPPFDFKTRKEKKIKINTKYPIAFTYSEFACIVDYLITNYGKEKFLLYMKSLINDNNHDKIFKQIYQISFDDVMIKFHEYVNQNINTISNHKDPSLYFNN